VPPALASDSQRDYLRAFGDPRWNDSTLTKDQAHDLIGQFIAKDAPTNWSFRDSYPATEDQFEKYHYFGGKPFSALKNEPAGVNKSEPPPLRAADFSILAAKPAAPVKKAWWKFW
jgi:hypothetical protein